MNKQIIFIFLSIYISYAQTTDQIKRVKGLIKANNISKLEGAIRGAIRPAITNKIDRVFSMIFIFPPI